MTDWRFAFVQGGLVQEVYDKDCNPRNDVCVIDCDSMHHGEGYCPICDQQMSPDDENHLFCKDCNIGEHASDQEWINSYIRVNKLVIPRSFTTIDYRPAYFIFELSEIVQEAVNEIFPEDDDDQGVVRATFEYTPPE